MSSYDYDFISTLAELSYAIGKGDVKTKKDVKEFITSSMPFGTDSKTMSKFILWALQNVLEDDKNPLYDEDLNFPGWEVMRVGNYDE